MTVERTINVELGEKSYDIFIGNDLEKFIEEWMLRVYANNKVFMIIDAAFYEIYKDDVEQIFKNIDCHIFPLEASEERKNHDNARAVYEFLLDKECDRRSLIVSFGGGVTGDIVGFCAATFMRGVDYIQIPTTLLAQVDSSVGGKTGINFKDAKNVIGSFFQPRAVFIDIKYLSTLDDRNFLAGLAEVLKVGFIGDGEIIRLLRGKELDDIRSHTPLLMDVISRSIQYKIAVVEADEKESWQRKVLNFGHTIGHGIEEATSYTRLLHGEAVAAGMAIEAQISLTVGACAEETRNIVIGVLENLRYEILPENVDYSNVFALFMRDKKRALDTLDVPVLTDVGRSEIRTFQLKDYEKYAVESLNFLQSFMEAKVSSKVEGEIYQDLDVLESSGRFNDAENLVMRLLDKDPTDEKLNLTLARLYSRQGKNVAALRILDEIIQLNPGNKEAIAMRREYEAIEDRMQPEGMGSEVETIPSETVIKIGEDVYKIEGIEDDEYSEGEGEEEPGEPYVVAEEPLLEVREEAVPTLEEVAEDEIPVYTTAMAEVLLREGKRDKSLEVLEKILKDDPGNEGAIRLRDKIDSLQKKERMLNRYAEAINSFLQKIVEAYR